MMTLSENNTNLLTENKITWLSNTSYIYAVLETEFTLQLEHCETVNVKYVYIKGLSLKTGLSRVFLTRRVFSLYEYLQRQDQLKVS